MQGLEGEEKKDESGQTLFKKIKSQDCKGESNLLLPKRKLCHWSLLLDLAITVCNFCFS